MSGRLYALGDLHGHHTELMNLYQQLLDAGLVPERDTVVALGDFIDGGPDTRKVIDQLMAWSQAYPHWGFLKGNHCQMMLDALSGEGDFDHWWYQGGIATAQSYLPERLTPYQRALIQPKQMIYLHHLEWLAHRPLLHVTDNYVFVHAGLIPNMTIQEHIEALDDPTVRSSLLWIRDSFIDSGYDWGKRVVFGHTAVKEPIVMPNKLGIDTLMHDYGKLTAVDLTGNDPVFYHQEAVKGPWPM